MVGPKTLDNSIVGTLELDRTSLLRQAEKIQAANLAEERELCEGVVDRVHDPGMARGRAGRARRQLASSGNRGSARGDHRRRKPGTDYQPAAAHDEDAAVQRILDVVDMGAAGRPLGPAVRAARALPVRQLWCALSEEIAVKMRRLVCGEWYQRRWGDRVKIRDDQNRIG